MSFITLTFLVFFAIVFWGYYLIPKKFQWMWLLAGSLVFYAFSTWWALFYLLGTIALTYGSAVWLDSIEGKRKLALKGVKDKEEKTKIKSKFEGKKKSVIFWSLFVLVGLLVVVKYTNFVLKNVTSLFKLDEFTLNIILPIGLSFYLFQSIGYLVDVYRGQYEAEKNFFKFALYVSYFPHVLQGPLDDYQSVSEALYASREFDYAKVVSGAKRAAWGFFKKMVIANQIAVITGGVISSGGAGADGLTIIFCMVLYSIELYADFSGYMDIAIGCSRMLGIEIAENFDSPYFSGSITEFWRRWHITLGTWFKNYVFYSILRSSWCTAIRKGLKKNKYLSNTVPTVLALVIVWLLIGGWHGAAWCFILYGIYHGFFVVMDSILSPVYDLFHKKCAKLCNSKIYQVFRVIRTFALVTLGYYIFAPASLSFTKSLLIGSTHFELWMFRDFCYENFREILVVLFAMIPLIYADVYALKKDRLPLGEVIAKKKTWVRWLVYILFLVAILFFRSYAYSSLDAFAYFKF